MLKTILLALIPIIGIPFLLFQEIEALEKPPVTVVYTETVPTLTPGQLSQDVVGVLEQDFTNQSFSDLTRDGWQSWIEISPEDPWQAEELVIISDILNAVVGSLDGEGLNGRQLLEGYRFRRQYGEYITGHDGRIAVVNHDEQVITLADAAFKRLHGFYIIHEIGHVVDRRTERQMSAAFHALAGSDTENRLTAPGYWLNLHAETDLEEATADAFALWIMSTYDAGYKPVFAYTPSAAKYDQIEALLAASVDTVAVKN